MLDFSDLLSDLDLSEAGAFTVLQTTRMLGTGTPADVTNTVGPLTGPVQPGGSSVNRISDGSIVSGLITVWSPVALTQGYRIDDMTHRLADIVTWHGDRYVVRSASDWSAVGVCQAVCELVTLNAAS